MMEYKRFVKVISDAIECVFDGEVKVEEKQVVRNNGFQYHGIIVKHSAISMSPVINTERMYNEILDDESKFKEVVNEIFDIVYASFHKNGNEFDLAEYVQDFSDVQTSIRYKIVNRDNDDYLNDKVYKDFVVDDLIKVYYITNINVTCTQSVDSKGSILITDKLLEYWGITVNELDQVATENTESSDNIYIDDLYNVIKEFGMIEDEGIYSSCSIKVVSTKDRLNGAFAGFMDEVLSAICEEWMCDEVVIIPSSIHETIILDVQGDIEGIKEMVSNVNDTVVSIDEVLSNNVYIYNNYCKEIRTY